MDALGIINFEDNYAAIDGLGDFRPVPAISFMGRYRVIDFILSNMTNSGIDNVQVFCKEKPRNLIEHLGSGASYNINSKRGRLRILYGEKSFSSQVYNNDIANFNLNMQYIEADANPYVIVAPSYFVYSVNFNDVMKQHIESGADITVLCRSTDSAKTSFLNCDTLTLDKNRRVTSFDKNHGSAKNRNISLECYVMSKRIFMELCARGGQTSSLYWMKDVLADSCASMDIRGYIFHGYIGCLNSLSEYYRISMELRDADTARELFRPGWPVYTQTNDSCPTRFTETARAVNSIIANGCVIKGEVDGCILGRNVLIEKGAILKDCIVLADAVVHSDICLEKVIVDKYAEVEHVHYLAGTDTAPIYVRRRDHV